jgi:hypothetical protein
VQARLGCCLFLVALLGWSVPAESQLQTSLEERFFRIEWQLERVDGRDVAIVGLLDNHYLYRLEWVQLEARVLDEAGQATHEARTTVTDVPPNGRSSFRLPLPATGARYAVTVHAFAFGPRESP